MPATWPAFAQARRLRDALEFQNQRHPLSVREKSTTKWRGRGRFEHETGNCGALEAVPTCGFHRHLCRTCSLRSWDDAASAFGVIYEVSTAPCGSNAFHAPSKRKLAIAPVGNFPPADAGSLFKSAWASSSARSCRAGL